MAELDPAITNTKKPKRKSSRKPGKPKKEDSLRPKQIQEIGRLYLEGWSQAAIAEKFHVCIQAINHHIVNKFRPMWKEMLAEDLEADMAQVREIQKAAWERYRKTKLPEDLKLATWAIEYRAKITGSFAPQKHSVSVQGSLRVAGSSRVELDESMMRRLLEKVQERLAEKKDEAEG